MEESTSADLFILAQGAAARIGLETLHGRSVGGASDGNLTAAAGLPTLDGLGAVGDGAHADHEWVSIPALAERAALVAALILAALAS
jgi:glutamate carboxypeptidase